MSGGAVQMLLVLVLGTFCLLMVPAMIVFIRALRQARRQEHRLDLRCQHCGYSRKGHLLSTTCPECGGPLDDYGRRYGLRPEDKPPVIQNPDRDQRVS